MRSMPGLLLVSAEDDNSERTTTMSLSRFEFEFKLARTEEELDALKAAIRRHRDEKGHDRCWEDDARLYAVLGEGEADGRLPPRDEFLRNCERFYELRRAPGGLDQAPEGTIEARVKKAWDDGYAEGMRKKPL